MTVLAIEYLYLLYSITCTLVAAYITSGGVRSTVGQTVLLPENCFSFLTTSRTVNSQRGKHSIDGASVSIIILKVFPSLQGQLWKAHPLESLLGTAGPRDLAEQFPSNWQKVLVPTAKIVYNNT